MSHMSCCFKLAHRCGLNGCSRLNDIGVFETQQQCVDFVHANMPSGEVCMINAVPWMPTPEGLGTHAIAAPLKVTSKANS